MASKNLFLAFRQISGLTAVSRLLGFIRDVVFAYYLGAGAAADAFLVAFKLPNLFRRLTAEGALTNAFLPSYSLAGSRNVNMLPSFWQQRFKQLYLWAYVLLFWLWNCSCPSLLAVLPDLTRHLVAGSAVELARLTMPYLPMISLVALWALLNSQDPFWRLICASNFECLSDCRRVLCAILSRTVATVCRSSWSANCPWRSTGGCRADDIYAAAIEAPAIRVPLFRFSFSGEARKMWFSFIPAALGAGVMQINLLVDLVLASLLATGSISWLYYADRLAQLPLGLVGIAMSTTLLPRLSRIEAERHVTTQAKQQISAQNCHMPL